MERYEAGITSIIGVCVVLLSVPAADLGFHNLVELQMLGEADSSALSTTSSYITFALLTNEHAISSRSQRNGSIDCKILRTV
jgi:hypothetical protein